MMVDFNESKLKIAKNDYKNHGFCILREIINGLEVEKLLKILNDIIERYKDHDEIGSYINYASKDKKIVNSIHRIEELESFELEKFIEKNGFLELAEFILDSEVELFSIQAFLKPAGTGLRTPAHQDNAYWCHSGNGGLTFWIALDKAGKFNSMMKFAKNSPNHVINHQHSRNTPGSSLIIKDDLIKDFDWVQPELERGDISVHNGLVVHYSHENKSKFKRRGFLLNFKTPLHIKDEKKEKEYLQKLESIYGRTLE